MVKKGTAVGLRVDDLKGKVHCEPCLMGKAQRLPFPQASKTTVKKLLGLVAMDMWGPARVPTLGRRSIYVLSFIDYLSGRVWAYLLPNKEAATVLAAAQKWLVKAQRQCGEKLHTLRSDNGTEFKGVMGEWLEAKGIERQFTAPYSPQQNGRVERWHRTMIEGIRTLLLASGLPANLWGEALRYLIWVKNRLTHSSLPDGKSPMEFWTGEPADLSLVKNWGSMVCSLLAATGPDGKLSPRGKMFVLLGVDDSTKGWRIMDPQTKEVTVSRNLHFTEGLMWKQWRAENPEQELELSRPEEVLNVLPTPAGEVWLDLSPGEEPRAYQPPAEESEDSGPELQSILRTGRLPRGLQLPRATF